MATAEKMKSMMKESGLDKFLQETVLGLIEKQPVVSPDTLGAIAMAAPVTTPEEDAARVASLKQRIQLMKKDVPPPADAPPPRRARSPSTSCPWTWRVTLATSSVTSSFSSALAWALASRPTSACT